MVDIIHSTNNNIVIWVSMKTTKGNKVKMDTSRQRELVCFLY